jgi:hypothetical protein
MYIYLFFVSTIIFKLFEDINIKLLKILKITNNNKHTFFVFSFSYFHSY